MYVTLHVHVLYILRAQLNGQYEYNSQWTGRCDAMRCDVCLYSNALAAGRHCSSSCILLCGCGPVAHNYWLRVRPTRLRCERHAEAGAALLRRRRSRATNTWRPSCRLEAQRATRRTTALPRAAAAERVVPLACVGLMAARELLRQDAAPALPSSSSLLLSSPLLFCELLANEWAAYARAAPGAARVPLCAERCS
jgi:hypothetical protein